ncbi:MAG TPA: DUF4126 domain-containing protein [Candidatus Xenobia bacterium]|nr:DUF4126 domain-containing protein [Candidatus Xenobia bacterium]
MGALQTLGFILGAAFASGLNLYATVAVLGLLHRFEVIHLPATLQVLADPWVLGLAIGLYVVEFVADKVPYVDNIWDVVHTFIRPPAAGLLAYTALGDVPEVWKVSAALLAGTVALASHGTKASTRAAVNVSPEPVSNWLLSLAEDGIAVTLVLFAVSHPLLTLAIVLVLLALSVYLLIKFFGFLRSALRRLFRRASLARG